ncbi:MAG: DUF3127 domain-containing protein [Bacteroidales bacterium]|nr:DUF3127 domain-containing protein [Bacteroidales bacterium]MDY5226446.1 DUF3127 domain-containing protein [Sodaliphilus sp.]
MEIIGKIILKLPLQTGVSKAGNNWSKQEYVLETQENFPKKVHFDFFGDRATQYDLQEGQMVKLSFDIESREYNGRWYTSIRGWKAEPADAQAPVYAGAPAGAPAVGGVPVQPAAAPAAPAAPAPDFMNESSNADDLPF